ncbi:hypothetical protein O9992_28180 [Vibrio lentus]|nr:hypothetical protein [Vibrio lentus]
MEQSSNKRCKRGAGAANQQNHVAVMPMKLKWISTKLAEQPSGRCSKCANGRPSETQEGHKTIEKTTTSIYNP